MIGEANDFGHGFRLHAATERQRTKAMFASAQYVRSIVMPTAPFGGVGVLNDCDGAGVQPRDDLL